MSKRHVCCGCGGLCDSTEPCPMSYNCKASPQTRHQMDALKAEWRRDRGEWNLEDAPGWESHRAELTAYRLEIEAQWEAERKQEHAAAIEKLMAPAVARLHGLYNEVIAGERKDVTYDDVVHAIGEVVLPIVERMNYLSKQHDQELRKLEDYIDRRFREMER